MICVTCNIVVPTEYKSLCFNRILFFYNNILYLLKDLFCLMCIEISVYSELGNNEF